MVLLSKETDMEEAVSGIFYSTTLDFIETSRSKLSQIYHGFMIRIEICCYVFSIKIFFQSFD